MYCPRFPILDIGLIGLHSLYWFLLDFMEFYSRQDGKQEEAKMAINQMIVRGGEIVWGGVFRVLV